MNRILIFVCLVFCVINLTAIDRPNPIENFDDGSVTLTSYGTEDLEPNAWSLIQTSTYNNSPYSLRLTGNCWKEEAISPVQLDSNSVWQVAAKILESGTVQGIGFGDSLHTVFYAFSGSEEVDPSFWISVYQGYFAVNQWVNYKLPIANDWYAWYDYLPAITKIIYVNDRDTAAVGKIAFDEILDITDILPVPPQVSFTYTINGGYFIKNGNRNISVSFQSQVIDPDNGVAEYMWDFGDSTTSSEPNPNHDFTIQDNHPYTISLSVKDSTNCWGYAVAQITPEEGETSYPVTMNFVGDIMLTRGYEDNIIPDNGVNSIFTPTKSVLEDADLTIANLECCFTTSNIMHPTKSVKFHGLPEYVQALPYAGIDIVTIANNHVYDCLEIGLTDTRNALEANNILYSGAGMTSQEAYKPLFVNKKGVNFAFLASSDRTGQYNNAQPFLHAGFNKPGFALLTPFYLQEQINEVAPYADFKIVEMHAGSEYSLMPGSNYDKSEGEVIDETEDEDSAPRIDLPPMWDVQIRHFAIDQGADLVIVHHSHIIQGLELYNGKLIAHSLGNFAFDLTYLETFSSMILNTKLNQDGFYEFGITPVFIDNFMPRLATGELANHILDYVAWRSKALNTYLAVNRIDNTASVIKDSLNMQMFPRQNARPFTMTAHDTEYISETIPLKRRGSISSIDQITPFGNWEYRLGIPKLWVGNFENEGSDFWSFPNTNSAYNTFDYFAGQRSICMNLPANTNTQYVKTKQKIKRYSHSTAYTLNGYIKTQNVLSANIQIRYFNTRESGASSIGNEYITANITGNTDWTQYSLDLTIPDNANYFDIRLASSSSNSGVSYAWFDNVELIEWDNWTSITNNLISSPNNYYFMQWKSSANITDASFIYTEIDLGQPPVETSDTEVSKTSILTLQQNYPNPFNPSTKISFDLKSPGHVEASIYNIKGQKVCTLLKNTMPQGKHTLLWEGRNDRKQKVSSGIYFCKVKSGNQSKYIKMVLLK